MCLVLFVAHRRLKRQVSGVTSRAIFHRGSNSELYFCRCLAYRLDSWYPCRGIVYQEAQQVRWFQATQSRGDMRAKIRKCVRSYAQLPYA